MSPGSVSNFLTGQCQKNVFQRNLLGTQVSGRHTALGQGRSHAQQDLPLPAATLARYARMAEDSLAAQRKIEAADSVPFETYRQQYLSKDLLSGSLLRSPN